jgi:uncharacterized repeat protein (TIGR03803 family)
MKMRTTLWTALLFYTVSGVCALAQNFKTLASFDGSNGKYPQYGPLVQGLSGNLYGTTLQGGTGNAGTVFKVSPGGALTTLYSFLCSAASCVSGESPYAGLTLGVDGDFYGVTSQATFGNPDSCQYGCAFKITPESSITTLKVFDYVQGIGPFNGLFQPGSSTLYGTAMGGGHGGGGTLYSITPNGSFKLLYEFTTKAGVSPFAVLIAADGGNFYGTTVSGGVLSECGAGCGTVFGFNPTSETLTTLYTFCSQSNCADGAEPYAGLVQASDGNFYGTTLLGGSSICESGCGTISRVTPNGELTTLYTFCTQANCTDGYFPRGALIEATDGALYGTTSGGGADGNLGTVFKITLGGALTTLHSFSATDGNAPFAGLVQATNGNFYGNHLPRGYQRSRQHLRAFSGSRAVRTIIANIGRCRFHCQNSRLQLEWHDYRLLQWHSS